MDATRTKTKTCGTCFSEIDVRAKKCAFCRESQVKSRKLTIRSILLIVSGLLVALVVVGSLVWIQSRNYAADIKVVSSELYFTPRTDGKSVSIVGELRNAGTIPVNVVVLEIRVSNRDGKLIDSFRLYIRERIEPNDEISFKRPGYQIIHLPETDYAAHDIIVRSAKLK